VITLFDVKSDLRVRHEHDDHLIQKLLDAAVDEALQFMNRATLPQVGHVYGNSPEEYESGDSPDEDAPVHPSVWAAVFLLVQAGYDRMKPEEVQLRRERAEQLLMPFRVELGV